MKARPNARMQIVDVPGEGDVVQLFNINSPERASPRYTPAGAAAGFVSPIIATGPNQALSGTGDLGAIDLASALTTISTTGAATATLAEGTLGQLKTIRMIADLGDMVITVAGAGIATITLNDVGDVCTVQWDGAGWEITDNSGCVIA